MTTVRYNWKLQKNNNKKRRYWDDIILSNCKQTVYKLKYDPKDLYHRKNPPLLV